MKKIIAMLLVLTMAMGMIACGNQGGGESTTTGAQANVPESALVLLETIWNSYADEEKFPVMGGDMSNMVDGAPGAYALDDEGITATLLVPEDQVAYIDDAASLVHGMMLNNFTCGVYRIAGDPSDFVKAMYESISNNPWMCGMPEKLIIAVIGGEYVLACFGINDAMGPFEQKLVAAYPDADLKYNEAIGG